MPTASWMAPLGCENPMAGSCFAPKEGGLAEGDDPHVSSGVAESVKVSVPPVRIAEAGSHGMSHSGAVVRFDDTRPSAAAEVFGRVMPETWRARM